MSEGQIEQVDSAGLWPRRHACDVELRDPPPEKQIALCVEWLKLYITPRRTVNTKASSYGLKHTVETWAGEYISNGAFIAAAQRLGYRIHRCVPMCVNAHFNMSFRRMPQTYVSRYEYECLQRRKRGGWPRRPAMFRAELRELN